MRGRAWTEEEEEYLSKNYIEKTAKQMSAELGRTVQAITTRLKLLGLRLPENVRKERFHKNGIETFKRINGGFGKDNLNKNRNPRASNSEYNRRQKLKFPEKVKARELLRTKILSGKIKRGVCKVCGVDTNIEGHHTDYSKPYDVVWLCKKHHKMLHDRKLTLLEEENK